MIDKQIFLKNYEPEERLLLAKVLDQAHLCCKNNETLFSDFIDPVKSVLAENIVKKNCPNVSVISWGGYDEAERKIIAAAPSNFDISTDDFPVGIVKIIPKRSDYTKKPTHRDYLGSLMSLGLKREKFGDILPVNDGALVFISADMVDYVIYNLEKVANTAVTVSMHEGAINCEKNVKEARLTVSSLRADCYIASVYNLSRSKAEQLIKAEKMLLNYSVVKSSSQILKPNDIVTLRGFGRSRFRETSGSTKKGRIVIAVEIFSSPI